MSVDRFAGVGPHGVDQVGGGQRLQRAVDGGESDGVAATAQFVVQFLCGTESVDVVEQCDDRGPLAGGPDAGVGPAIGNHFH